MNSVYEEITERLRKRSFSGLDGDDYVKAGVIDSLNLLGWVLELESKFQVEFDDEDIVAARFRTVIGLTQMIEEKLLK